MLIVFALRKPAFIDDMDHQRGAPAAHTAAIHDAHQRLQGEMPEQDLRIGEHKAPCGRTL
jgi:hypothetical protein